MDHDALIRQGLGELADIYVRTLKGMLAVALRQADGDKDAAVRLAAYWLAQGWADEGRPHFWSVAARVFAESGTWDEEGNAVARLFTAAIWEEAERKVSDPE